MPRRKSHQIQSLEWEILSALMFYEMFQKHRYLDDKGVSIRAQLFPATGCRDFPQFTRTLTDLIKNQSVLRTKHGCVCLAVNGWSVNRQRIFYGESRGTNLYELAEFYSKRVPLGWFPDRLSSVPILDITPSGMLPVEPLPLTEWAILSPTRPETFRPELAKQPGCYTKFDSNTQECQSCLLSPECRTATVNMVKQWSPSWI